MKIDDFAVEVLAQVEDNKMEDSLRNGSFHKKTRFFVGKLPKVGRMFPDLTTK